MVTKGQLGNALVWQVLNITCQAFLQFAFISISARVLPQEVHGTFAILNAVIFVLSIASEGGVSSAIIQRKEVNPKHISIAFYITLTLSIILCALCLVLAYPISSFYEQKIIPAEIQWASLIFIFKALGSVSRAFLIKNFRFKQLFIANNTSFLLGNIIILFILAKLEYGIFALIFAFIITQFFQSLLYYVFARHSFAIKWGKRELKDITFFGSSFILLRSVNYFSSQADKLLIGRFFDVVSLSFFDKGQYISKMPSKYIGNSIDSVMFASFSKMEMEQKKKLFNIIFLVVTSIAGYFAVVVYFNSSLIVDILLGESWARATPYLQTFVFIIPAMLIARLGDIVVRSENKMFKSLPVKISFLIILVLTILAFKNWDLLDLTILIICVNWLHALGMMFLSRQILSLSYLKLFNGFFVAVIGFTFFAAKYYFITFLVDPGFVYAILNGLLDIALIGSLLYYFRRNKNIQEMLRFVKNKFSKIKKG